MEPDAGEATQDDGGLERREVVYRGRVQGVGFRDTTRWLAQQFRVFGFVQNLPDGRVLLVVEGEPDELERFLAAVDRELRRYIAGTEVRTASATGEYSHFSIRR